MIFGATVSSPHLAVSESVSHARESCLMDKVDDKLEFVQTFEVRELRWITGGNQRIKPARISALVPPQSTACSPKRSVSVSSRKVVSITPARVHPIPFAHV